jgi:hypothetical protein
MGTLAESRFLHFLSGRTAYWRWRYHPVPFRAALKALPAAAFAIARELATVSKEIMSQGAETVRELKGIVADAACANSRWPLL